MGPEANVFIQKRRTETISLFVVLGTAVIYRLTYYLDEETPAKMLINVPLKSVSVFNRHLSFCCGGFKTGFIVCNNLVDVVQIMNCKLSQKCCGNIHTHPHTVVVMYEFMRVSHKASSAAVCCCGSCRQLITVWRSLWVTLLL